MKGFCEYYVWGYAGASWLRSGLLAFVSVDVKLFGISSRRRSQQPLKDALEAFWLCSRVERPGGYRG